MYQKKREFAAGETQAAILAQDRIRLESDQSDLRVPRL
jgi:hypothetical protein